MAQRRMFSKEIVRSDAFLDMPTSSQLLYFQLGMEADDDGFVDNAKTVSRMAGTAEDDLKILLTKRFLLSFKDGILVIKHWKINNYIQIDRYKETKYLEHKNGLDTKDNRAYTERIQPVSTLDAQIRLDKVSLGKTRQEKEKHTPLKETEVFFTSKEKQEEIVAYLLESGVVESTARREIKKFVDYWLEKSSTGKHRWQAEKFFELKRRLTTWFSRIDNFTTKNNKGGRIIGLDKILG